MDRIRALVLLAALAGLAACGGTTSDAAEAAPATADATSSATADATSSAEADGSAAPATARPVSFTDADLGAYAAGRAREIALVREARERGRRATTPQERAAAAQAEWEDATMPEAARAAGLELERYRELRRTVDRVLETLDFQGAIDGPLEVNLEAAGEELKRRLQEDPFAPLTPASAAALRAQLPQLVPLWNAYMGLTALNG